LPLGAASGLFRVQFSRGVRGPCGLFIFDLIYLRSIMGKRAKYLDDFLADWPFVPGQVLVREISGRDGRPLLQMRVDMGIVQMETEGRPDGVKPEGFDTYYDYLVALSFDEGEAFRLDGLRCAEIDREFYQYYHRRICWLTLNKYPQAVRDAEHTLALMDFSAAFAPDPEWALLHEQYRPFVVFHKAQASALSELERSQPSDAVNMIESGLEMLAKIYEAHDAEEQLEEDPFVNKLKEMKDSIASHYQLGNTLAEQLAQAIAAEQYELAAELRDRMSNSGRR